MKNVLFAAGLAGLAAVAGTAAMAQSAGDFTLGLGLADVMPKSDNGHLDGAPGSKFDVKSNVRPTITFEYFVQDNLGIEVLGAWPFHHDTSVSGLGKVAAVHLLPPTVSLQYHFQTGTAFTPFVGAGVTYAWFFNTDDRGAAKASDLDLSVESKWAFSAHAGFDYAVSTNNYIRADVRYIDLSTDVRSHGDKIGTVDIDPWIAGVSFIHRF